MNPQQALPTAMQLLQTGRADQAAAMLREFLAANPDHPAALHLLGLAAFQQGQSADAIDFIRRAVALRPSAPDYHCNLGLVLTGSHRSEEAIPEFERAISLKPDYSQAWINLGAALKVLGRFTDAVAVCRKAVALNPTSAEAHSNLAVVLGLTQQLDDALAAARKAVALRPDFPDAWSTLAAALCNLGLIREGMDAHRKAVALKPTDPAAHSNLIFAMLADPDSSPAEILAQARTWNDRHAKPLAHSIRPHNNDRTPNRRLRIGYISGDFCQHISGRTFLPLIASHNHQHFEIFCYANVRTPDEMSDRIAAHADAWRPIATIPDSAVADLVRADQIDILVDLSLHTAHNRLLVFARKPAPIQACFLGYPGTTGLSTIDYHLTDPCLDPPNEHDDHYSEKLIRLPHTYQVWDPLSEKLSSEVAVNNLPALTANHMTFGCLNSFIKLSDPTLSLWTRTLLAIPHSRLILKAPQGSARQRVLDQFTQAGVDPARIEFAGHYPSRADFLSLYHRIDIFLDSLPYNAHTTSLDAYWMGVPTVTLLGASAVGRAGFSQLSNLSLTDLTAHSDDQFIQIAANLAADLPRLSALRQSLRQRLEQSPLCDAPAFARGIEAAYRQMWHAWCAR